MAAIPKRLRRLATPALQWSAPTLRRNFRSVELPVPVKIVKKTSGGFTLWSPLLGLECKFCPSLSMRQHSHD
jgi:hypothetical protein